MGRPPLMMKRTHISFTKESLIRLDALVGEKGRSKFVRAAVDQALDAAALIHELKARAGKRGE